MIFWIFVLFTYALGYVENYYETYKIEGRTIELNLINYCYDEITEVYIQEEENKNTLASEITAITGKVQGIFSIDIPHDIKKDFYILIIARPQIIKVGVFYNFEKFPRIVPSLASKIKSWYEKDLESFEEIRKEVLEDGNVKTKISSLSPTVKYFSTETEIYIDVSRFEKILKNKKGVECKIDNNKKKVNLPFKFLEDCDKIKIFDFEKRETVNARYVLCISELKKEDLEDFSFVITFFKYLGPILISSFSFNEETKAFKTSYPGDRAWLFISDALEKEMWSSNHKHEVDQKSNEEGVESTYSNSSYSYPKEETKLKYKFDSIDSLDKGPIYSDNSKESKNIGKDTTNEGRKLDRRKGLFKMIFVDYFWQMLIVAILFCFFAILIVAIILKNLK